MQAHTLTSRLHPIARRLLVPAFFLVLALLAYRLSYETRGPVDEEILFLECAAAQDRCPLGLFDFFPDRPLHSFTFNVSYRIFGWHFPPYLLIMPIFQWINAVLYYLVLRKLLPRRHLLAVAAAMIFLLFPGDAGRTFAGLIGVSQAILCMLLALWLMLNLADGTYRSPVAWVGMVICLVVAPMSYEQVLPLQFCLPILLLRYPTPGLTSSRKRLAVIWWIGCALFIGYRLVVLALRKEDPYHFNYYSGPLIGYLGHWLDWFTTGAVPVWIWAVPRARAAIALGSPEVRTIPLSVTIGMIVVTALLGWLIQRLWPDTSAQDAPSWLQDVRLYAGLFVLGLVIAFIGYTVVSYGYRLTVDHVSNTTRFHQAPALGFGLAIAALCFGLARLVSHFIGDRFQYLMAWTPIVLLASISLYSQMSLSRFWATEDWGRKKALWSGVIEVAPDVRPNTFIMLVNPPNYNDPRGPIWIISMLRFLYDDRTLIGDYVGASPNILTHSTFTPEGVLMPDRKGQVSFGDNPPTLYPYEDVLFINLGDGEFRSYGGEGLDVYLLDCLPDELVPEGMDEICNDPSNVIIDGPPSRIAQAWLDLP